jgi:hypothetical protein
MTAPSDDSPIKEITIETFERTGRINANEKELRNRHPADVFVWKLPPDSPNGWKLLPAAFNMTVGPRPGPAEHHFVVHPTKGGATVIARLTDEQRTSGESGERRIYRYTLQLWIDGKHAGDIDPEIEYIWT